MDGAIYREIIAVWKSDMLLNARIYAFQCVDSSFLNDIVSFVNIPRICLRFSAYCCKQPSNLHECASKACRNCGQHHHNTMVMTRKGTTEIRGSHTHIIALLRG